MREPAKSGDFDGLAGAKPEWPLLALAGDLAQKQVWHAVECRAASVDNAGLSFVRNLQVTLENIVTL